MIGNMDKICSIIISYNSNEDLLKCYTSVIGQVDLTIIVDNGSSEPTRKLLADLSKNKNTLVIFNETNLGIATALNQGIIRAMELGFNWVLTLDHDSILSEDMVVKLWETYINDKDKSTIGIIAPVYVDGNTGEESKFLVKHGIGFKREYCQRDMETLMVIQSGCLMNVKALDNVGLFIDELFIDYVDNEMCLRLKNNGYRVIVSHSARLNHHLGERKEHRILNMKIYPTNHSLVRKYYIARNRMYVYKRYYKNIPFILFDILAFAYDIFRVSIFEKDKIKKIKMTFRGIKDGITGRYGQFLSN